MVLTDDLLRSEEKNGENPDMSNSVWISVDWDYQSGRNAKAEERVWPFLSRCLISIIAFPHAFHDAESKDP